MITFAQVIHQKQEINAKTENRTMRNSRRLFIVALMLMCSTMIASAQRLSLSGRVVTGEANPIAYATVVALKDGVQAAGGATNNEGNFTLALSSGSYTLNVSYVGYKSQTREVVIAENTNIGDITLEADNTAIDEVVVTAELIRREADRFVVDVANSPIALGKDGEELLKSVPGVWIQDDKISINGASGAKIYLNDREVKLEDAQLMAYLRSLRANDIQRIEVVPQTGADYDASTSGGIIKITTKRRLDSGLMGSASFNTNGARNLINLGPSLSLNYNQGKVNAYARAWAGTSKSKYTTEEHTDYTSGSVIDAATEMLGRSTWAGGQAGIVYDITDKHSVGAEFQYNYWANKDITETWTERDFNSVTTHSDGTYNNRNRSNMMTATLNYIYKLDDKGSTLKLIGDYTDSNSPVTNNYFDTNYNLQTPDIKRDSTYRYAAKSHYQMATATLALEKILSPKVTLKSGLKYTFNTNNNKADYEYLKDNEWLYNGHNSYDIGYTENIGAAYVIATARLGRWSLVGGLRSEYTSFRSADKVVKQDYFDLFPNANVSYSLKADGSYSLIAQYSRTISRPSFWALSPNESKISEYMIQRGNPNLKPSYNNSVSITAVLKYKYTITLGMQIMENAIQQTTLVDTENPELLILQTINYPTLNNYYASVNLPFQFTKWWSANINLTAMYMGQRIYPDEPVRRNFMGVANAQMSFTLPKNFFIELDGMYMHGAQAGNTRIGDFGNLNLTLKKRMLDNKLTLSLGAQNLIPTKQRIYIEEDSFSRLMIVDQPWQRIGAKFSISYNFNSGKQFRAKSVESGSADDRSRLGGGSRQ